MPRGVFTASTPLARERLNECFNKPRCNIYINSTTDIPASTLTTLEFDSERFDIGGLHSTVSNRGRITIPSGCAGVYFVAISIVWVAIGGTGRRTLYVNKNGVTFAESNEQGATNLWATNRVHTILSLAEGDYLEAVLFHDNASALQINPGAGDYPHHFSAIWLRPAP